MRIIQKHTGIQIWYREDRMDNFPHWMKDKIVAKYPDVPIEIFFE